MIPTIRPDPLLIIFSYKPPEIFPMDTFSVMEIM